LWHLKLFARVCHWSSSWASLSLLPSYVQIFSSASCSQTPLTYIYIGLIWTKLKPTPNFYCIYTQHIIFNQVTFSGFGGRTCRQTVVTFPLCIHFTHFVQRTQKLHYNYIYKLELTQVGLKYFTCTETASWWTVGEDSSMESISTVVEWLVQM
jgi:hypothetical protein